MKTKAYGIGGKTYCSKDIDNPAELAVMTLEKLFDEDEQEVEPVRTGKDGRAAHFRVVGSLMPGQRIGRSENDPTHEKAVDLIKAKLTGNGSPFVLATHSPYEREVVIIRGKAQSVMKSTPIFETLPISRYSWFKECDARIWLDKKRYIQPDLMGCNSLKSSPSPTSPEIVIEVIRTHPPCSETYELLRDRTHGNCLVLFYFVAPGRISFDMNSIGLRGGTIHLRANYYLRDGMLFYRGTPAVLSPGDNQSASAQHAYICKAHFDPAMNAVASEARRNQS